MTINVKDVNETPEFEDGATTTRSVAENSAAGTAIGTPVSASDKDGDTMTYSLAGTDAGDFSIDTATGQIKVKAELDYEAKASYSVEVNVTDSEDNSGNPDTTTDATIAVTVVVTDENEPPLKPDAPDVTGNDDDPKTKLDVSWTAPNMTGKPPVAGL